MSVCVCARERASARWKARAVVAREQQRNERILVLDYFMYVTDLVHITVCLSYGRASYSRYITVAARVSTLLPLEI